MGGDLSLLLGDSWTVFKDVLALTEELRCPHIFMPWALIGLASAVFAPRCYVRISSNAPAVNLTSGVVLAGRSGLGQATIIDVMERIAKQLGVKLGPSDSGGQRPGLISALQIRKPRRIDTKGQEEFEIPASIDAFADMDFESVIAEYETDRAAMSFFTDDIGRILQSHGREIYDFVYDGLRGRSMSYRTKVDSIYIHAPSVSILAGATVDTLRRIFPADGTQSNLLTRLMICYSSKRAPVVRPRETRNQTQLYDLIDMLVNRLGESYQGMRGEIKLTEKAKKSYALRATAGVKSMNIYIDSYNLMRQEHLIRTAALIALLRGEKATQITHTDIDTADFLLVGLEEQLNLLYTGITAGTEGKAMIVASEIYEIAKQENQAHLPHEALVVSLILAGVKHFEAARIMDKLVENRQFSADAQGRLGPSQTGQDLAIYALQRRVKRSQEL